MPVSQCEGFELIAALAYPCQLMSLHAQNPAIEAKIRSRRRISVATSILISLLTVALLVFLLSLFFMAPSLRERSTIVAYESGLREDNEPEVKKSISQVARKPSAPSSAMARVITANVSSPTSVPVPDVEVSTPSLLFGDADDFEAGWVDGNGPGTGGGASFFGQQVTAGKIAYVIDYSNSMRRDQREMLMRTELKRSVSDLKPGMMYQLIFFAGRPWVAGDKAPKKKAAKQDGDVQRAEWMTATPEQIGKSVELVLETGLTGGTHWEPALDMAMTMDPPPQMIFFMTDGTTGGDPVAVAERVAEKAKSAGITINTVAMMEPKAEEAMKQLARRTGGQFSMIGQDGKVREDD